MLLLQIGAAAVGSPSPDVSGPRSLGGRFHERSARDVDPTIAYIVDWRNDDVDKRIGNESYADKCVVHSKRTTNDTLRVLHDMAGDPSLYTEGFVRAVYVLCPKA